MKKRKRLVSPTLSNVPFSEVPIRNTNPPQTPKEFLEQEERERQEAERRQKEIDERPLRLADQELYAAARERDKRLLKMYSLPLDALTDLGLEFTLSDLVGDYPLQEGPIDSKADAAAYREFKENLASQGCTLSTDGWSRLGSYLAAVRFHRGISLASVATWAIGLERLIELGVFQPGESSGYESAKPNPPVEKQPESKPTFDELLKNVSTETNDGRKRWLEAMAEETMTAEFRPCWQAFVESVYENFGHLLTELEKKAIYDTFVRRGLSLKNPAHYDQVRVALVQVGTLPKHLLYPAEQLAVYVENADLSDRSVRQEFARRTRDLERI